MADLKPIGSEKLQGQDKINRMMEIARFKEVIPGRINETAKTEYNRTLADGNNYEIVKERQGYILKRTITESGTDYMEPMKNRKYYSSYSQALKRLNLVAGELNRINENETEVSMFGEQKKFTLKTPKPAPSMAAPMAPPAAPPAVPTPELPASPTADSGAEDDFNMDIDSEEMGPEGDVDVNDDIDIEEPSGDDETVTFKTIQKLTGKLTQKIRTLENEEGMTSEDIKYVINMVISSLELSSLSEEDKEDIIDKFEEDETEEFGQEDDMDGEDLTDDSEVEDIQADMDIPMEGEMDEDMYGSFDDEEWYDQNDKKHGGDFDFDFDEEEFEDFPSLMAKHGSDKHKWFGRGEQGEKMFNTYKNHHNRPFKVRSKKSDLGNGAIFDSIFGESKVDKVLSKYFEVSKQEILENREKVANKNLTKISEVRRKMGEVVKLTETIEQELASQKFLEKNSSAKIVGKTNKDNLVFENKGRQVRITPKGQIL
jgi:hypothetical protein